MKLLRLEFQGFRSFQAPTQFDFSSMAPGLYHVRGRNEVEPELEANGAGKSTLFEVAHWCLYGKTSQGVRAGSVASWAGNEQCVVAADWETPSGTVAMLRTWGPNELSVCEGFGDPRPIAQDEIDKLLCSQSVYLFSMFFAQFAPTFIDLSPSEQSAVFTDVLSLGIWEDAAKGASTDVARIEQALRIYAEERAGLVGQLTELADSGFEEAEGKWDINHKRDLRQATAACAIAEEQITLCQGRVGQARVDAVVYREVADKELSASRSIDGFENAIKKFIREVEELKNDDYKKCPTCGAPVSNAHIKKELAAKQKEVDALTVSITKARDKHLPLLVKLKELKGHQQALIEAEKAMAVASAAARTADARLTDIQTAENPYTKQREEADQRGEALMGALDRIDGLTASLSAQMGATAYWVKGFKEIRLSLINDSLAQLTIEANEVLYQMGLQDWHIEFDVERETKSGTINKNFTVLIHSPHTDTAVPWEAWSGGEKQRLRLAITMGFANLVGSRSGMQPNVEMWDEPSTGLSEAGIYDMLDVLADRARRYSRVILLADHRALDFGGFTGAITVVKGEHGSRIES